MTYLKNLSVFNRKMTKQLKIKYLIKINMLIIRTVSLNQNYQDIINIKQIWIWVKKVVIYNHK